jgi:hypothetical protein
MKAWANKKRAKGVPGAFAVAIGGKADMPFCTAHVRF